MRVAPFLLPIPRLDSTNQPTGQIGSTKTRQAGGTGLRMRAEDWGPTTPDTFCQKHCVHGWAFLGPRRRFRQTTPIATPIDSRPGHYKVRARLGAQVRQSRAF